MRMSTSLAWISVSLAMVVLSCSGSNEVYSPPLELSPIREAVNE